MTAISAGRASLVPWSMFAALIAAAGLPIYIHAPKFYADTYAVNLAALGGVLALLRLIDVVQDPVLGWLAEVMRARRGMLVAGATALMAMAMFGLFAIVPPIAPLLWFALMLTGLFSGFSFLTIAFYAQGVEKAGELGPDGHLRLAGWRETGALVGVSFAAVAPIALAGLTDRPFVAFAAGFAVLAVLAGFVMRDNWTTTAPARAQSPTFRSTLAVFRPALTDRRASRLLLLALVNSAPVAVTSTLFLFFVESRLALPGTEGAFLLLFFVSAAASTPVWSRLARRWGERRILSVGMTLSIASFLWALLLGPGQWGAFAVISAASGAALGADMVMLPAMFARRLAQIGQGGESAAFGLWSFVSKLSLALAAATLLPALAAVGFVSGAGNSPASLDTLALLYAGLPCALKALALIMLTFFLPDEE